MKAKARQAVLRNYNASTEARYYPRDHGAALARIEHALRFRSEKAANAFLSANNELKGYRAEVYQ